MKFFFPLFLLCFTPSLVLAEEDTSSLNLPEQSKPSEITVEQKVQVKKPEGTQNTKQCLRAFPFWFKLRVARRIALQATSCPANGARVRRPRQTRSATTRSANPAGFPDSNGRP